jgi:hypothetical protein
MLHQVLLANSFRVLPVLILTSEDPLHAVLQHSLLLFRNRPRSESVDVCRIVDTVEEVLLGVDFVRW